MLCVHRESNHPPSITRNIPAGINKRISSLPSDQNAFDLAAPAYQKALDESGYNYKLTFEPPVEDNRRKNRPRNDSLWYNPPFSKNVNTNIGQRFFSLIKRCFHKDHSLRMIFNKNKVKIS